jgi:hypothetical protein
MLYLNRWILDFNLENGILLTVPVWVILSRLPLHCWNDEVLKFIGKNLGTYINKVEPKDGMMDFAGICVEVYLEKGLTEVVQLVP